MKKQGTEKRGRKRTLERVKVVGGRDAIVLQRLRKGRLIGLLKSTDGFPGGKVLLEPVQYRVETWLRGVKL